MLTIEANKATTRRVLEDVFNHGILEAIDTGFTPDAVIHDPGLELRGPLELRKGIDGLRTAFPDFHFTMEDQLAEGDLVAVRYRGQGTQRAEFLGVPATGKHIDYTGMIIVRLHEGKIAEFWAQPDQLGLLKQLGARVSLS
jgi:predicted ester cyclase